jgi:hypothetical protein
LRLAPAVLVISTALALALALPARAATWSEVFSTVPDTVVFLGADGSLLRAPFSLATRETLWSPADGQRLVRIRVSPDGRRVAWLTRAHDHDATLLWVDKPGGGVPRARYFAFEAQRYGQAHSEAAIPTVEDRDSRGGRLIQPRSLMRRVASNTIEWTPDSRAVVFGYDDGIAAVPADSGGGFVVSKAFAVGLEALEPAAIYLVDAVVLRERLQQMPQQANGTHPSEAPAIMEDGVPLYTALELGQYDVLESRAAYPDRYLLYPLAGRWRVFTAGGLSSDRLRAASPGTVWWAVGPAIHAIRTHDPNPTVEVRSPGTVVWLGYDEGHRALVWAAGSEVFRRPEDGGDASTVLRTGSPIRVALPSRTGHRVGFVTGDSVVVWDPLDDSARRVALGGLKPVALFETPAGEVLVQSEGGRGDPLGLARADFATERWVALEMPPVKSGRFVAAPGSAHLLLFDPAPKPPATLHVLDVATGRWEAVANPGIAGWEPLEPR